MLAEPQQLAGMLQLLVVAMKWEDCFSTPLISPVNLTQMHDAWQPWLPASDRHAGQQEGFLRFQRPTSFVLPVPELPTTTTFGFLVSKGAPRQLHIDRGPPILLVGHCCQSQTCL